MNLHYVDTRRTRSNSVKGMLALVALLILSWTGFALLPWPNAIDNGWLVAVLMIAGGMVLGRLRGGTFLPETNRPATVLWFGIGALSVQAAIHVAAIGGF